MKPLGYGMFNSLQLIHITKSATKTQRGMYKTTYRRDGFGNTHAHRGKILNSLLARGTTDKLGNFWLYKSKASCPQCGRKIASFKLSKKGKQRLEFLRLKRGY